MSTITQPRRSVNAKSRPLNVEQIIASTPIAPATVDPWYADRKVYDVDKADLVFGVRIRHKVIPGTWKVVREAQRMDACRSFRVRVRELADNGSLIGPVLSWNVAEVAAIVTDEPTPEPVEVCRTHVETPVAVDTFGPEWFDASRVVARGDACWLPPTSLIGAIAQRDAIRHALAQMGAVVTCDDDDREIRLVDDDGTALETPAEMDRRRREEHAAKVAELLTDNPFLAPCCDPVEPMPCTACANAHTLPDDLSGDDWEDGFRWEPTPDAGADPEVLQLLEDGALEQAEGEGPLADATPECFAAVAAGRADWAREFGWVPCPGWVTPENRADLLADEAVDWGWASRPRGYFEGLMADAFVECPPAAEDPEPRTLAEQVDDHARQLRSEGSPLGDLLAERAESLAGQIRALDATTVEQFRDRRQALLDADMDRARGRHASCC